MSEFHLLASCYTFLYRLKTFLVPHWSHSFVVLKCLQIHENKVKNSRTENLKILEYRKQLDLKFSGWPSPLSNYQQNHLPWFYQFSWLFSSKAILYCDQIGAFKLQRVHVLSGFMVCGHDAKEFRWILLTGCHTRKSAIKCVWSSSMSQAIKGIYFKLLIFVCCCCFL